MKIKQLWKQLLVRGLPALLILGAAGCGSSNSVSEIANDSKPEEAAQPAPAEAAGDEGTYNALGLKMDDAIVETDSLKGNYLEFREDGTGYLYFGDDNQGDISSWSNDGSFSMKAGVSEFTGTMKNGILELNLGDDYVITFAKDDADTSALKVMTLDEYKAAMTKENEAEAKSGGSPAGYYYAYAAESGDLCILLPEEDQDAFAFTMNEDGTGQVHAEGESEDVLWKLDGETLMFYEVTGEPATDDYEITLKDGIMTILVPGEDGEDDIYEYLVRDGADTSEIDARAVDPSTLQ